MKLRNLSKFLSLVLRHDPDRIGLQLDNEGWADVDHLLACLAGSGKITSLQELETVVAENDKQRFRFSEDRTRIRANQGHSIAIDLALQPVQPPSTLYHGTATRFLESIREKGLVKGSRQHVHLSAERTTAHKVGQRHGRPVILIVEAAKMSADGFDFFVSDNGVWLVDHVPVRFLQEID